MQIAIVKLLDATTFGYWSHDKDVDESCPKVCLAAGWLVHQDDKTITIALLTNCDKSEFSSWVTIPAGCILNVEILTNVEFPYE